jgi:hypothetical protein
MHVAIQDFIVFVLSNYSLTFLVIGLIFAAVAALRETIPRGATVIAEKLLKWHVFWAVGIGNLYNFVMHAFFGRMAAAFIGWPDSPFQFEVATASLGFGVVGILAAFRSFDMRLAAILAPAVFLLGAAAGHIYQMITADNFAPGNAGIVFYTDILIPILGFFFLWLRYRSGTFGETEQRPM